MSHPGITAALHDMTKQGAAEVGAKINHFVELGRLNAWLSRIVNRVALALDRRFPDGNETLLWMCMAEKT